MGPEACLPWAVLRLPFPLELVFYLPPSVAGCFPYTLLARAALASAVVLLGSSALAFARLGRGVVPFLDLCASAGAAVVAWIASQQGFVPIIPSGLGPGPVLLVPGTPAWNTYELQAATFGRVIDLVNALWIATVILVVVTAVALLWARVGRRRPAGHGA